MIWMSVMLFGLAVTLLAWLYWPEDKGRLRSSRGGPKSMRAEGAECLRDPAGYHRKMKRQFESEMATKGFSKPDIRRISDAIYPNQDKESSPGETRGVRDRRDDRS